MTDFRGCCRPCQSCRLCLGATWEPTRYHSTECGRWMSPPGLPGGGGTRVVDERTKDVSHSGSSSTNTLLPCLRNAGTGSGCTGEYNQQRQQCACGSAKLMRLATSDCSAGSSEQILGSDLGATRQQEREGLGEATQPWLAAQS
jgi:hypothetical protein